ncbi:lipopolysaccharide assembly LapA domain-containing protein [uncultured Metabacillus sp.]|uniref:LapA family protein n=1 Tax=Metabacillus sp. Hm71 TaxID=3450743 RepID=UPI00261CEF8F|nr:lipopolysaccharide assembly protein LapA domain-containing protein [uncultured Metabacillus sp.]
MKRQWSILLAIIFALIVALFAVINVDPVKVDYLFGTAEWPLVLIILGSVLMGGFIIASTGIIRILTLQRKLKLAEKEKTILMNELEALKEKVQGLPGIEDEEGRHEKGLAEQ